MYTHARVYFQQNADVRIASENDLRIGGTMLSCFKGKGVEVPYGEQFKCQLYTIGERG